jgi:hypothetical protein
MTLVKAHIYSESRLRGNSLKTTTEVSFYLGSIIKDKTARADSHHSQYFITPKSANG